MGVTEWQLPGGWNINLDGRLSKLIQAAIAGSSEALHFPLQCIILMPMLVHRLSCGSLRDEEIAGSQPVGWRSLVVSAGADQHPVALIDFEESAEDVGDIVVGDRIGRVAAALDKAHAFAQGSPVPYQLRFLEVRALFFEAVWIADPAGADLSKDRCIIYSCGDVDLPMQELRRLSEVSPSLRSAGERWLEKSMAAKSIFGRGLPDL